MRILLIVYDNGSYINWFPQGLGYLAAVLEREGHKVTVYQQDINHWPESHLTNYLNRNHFDIVCLSIIAGYYQYAKLNAISLAINMAEDRPLYIIGGHMCSPDPEYFCDITGADCIVVGEGENAILEFIGDHNKRVIYGKEIKEIDYIPFPAWHLFDMNHYRLLRMAHCTPSDFIMPILSGRGCSFHCNFCYRLMEGLRVRDKNAIMEEIRILQMDYGITYFTFSDELLMASVERTKELCHAFIDSGLKFKWDCNGRLNFAKPDVLELMKKAGCVFINYGIESIDNQVLRNMKKCLTVEQIIRGIECTLKSGISPGFNIIWGNIGDNIHTLNRGMEFLLKYDDGAQMRTIRPVTPYPGSPLFDIAIEKGMVKDVEDFYENKHTNSDLFSVNFMDISTEQAHAELLRVNTVLMERYFRNKSKSFIDQAKRLYVENDATFRGFRN